MNQTIWKYPLQVTDTQTIRMPEGAEILTVQTQGAGAYLWVVVYPDAPMEDRFIEIFGTGNPLWLGANRKYIGTFQQSPFVWHVFESIR